LVIAGCISSPGTGSTATKASNTYASKIDVIFNTKQTKEEQEQIIEIKKLQQWKLREKVNGVSKKYSTYVTI
jgi:hypothetical protein